MEYAIEAVFTENTTTYSVTYDASGGGTITAEGHEASPATVTYGQSITFTAVPAEYGYVKEWRVDGVPVSNSSNKTSYTLENVTQAHTVTVVFATAVRYDVSYAVNGGGGTLSAAARRHGAGSVRMAAGQRCRRLQTGIRRSTERRNDDRPLDGERHRGHPGEHVFPWRDYGSLPVQHTDH